MTETIKEEINFGEFKIKEETVLKEKELLSSLTVYVQKEEIKV